MKFTKEQIEKAKTAKSAEELLALAKENGIEMTEDEAERYFAQLHATGELADTELNNVAGGAVDQKGSSCNKSGDPPLYPVGTRVIADSGIKSNGTVISIGDEKKGWFGKTEWVYVVKLDEARRDSFHRDPYDTVEVFEHQLQRI